MLLIQKIYATHTNAIAEDNQLSVPSIEIARCMQILNPRCQTLRLEDDCITLLSCHTDSLCCFLSLGVEG